MFAACVKGQEVGGVVIQEKKAINKKRFRTTEVKSQGLMKGGFLMLLCFQRRLGYYHLGYCLTLSARKEKPGGAQGHGHRSERG